MPTLIPGTRLLGYRTSGSLPQNFPLSELKASGVKFTLFSIAEIDTSQLYPLENETSPLMQV